MSRTTSVFLGSLLLVFCLIPFTALPAQAQEVPVQRGVTGIHETHLGGALPWRDLLAVDGQQPQARAERVMLLSRDSGWQESENPLASAPDALSEKVLYSFAAGTDGASPVDVLVRDSSGNLYGTTFAGGASKAGTIFKLAPTGKETLLYTFTGKTDGGSPSAGLVRDAAGNLYGATDYGGNTTCASKGCGVVFKLTSTGTYSVLHSFAGYPADGALPRALIRDSQGNLYGTTYEGGDLTGNCGKVGCGVIFKLDTAGTETILYNFAGYPSDASGPEGALALDASGNLYGVASGGTVCNTCGTVFKLDTTGTESVLYSFSDKSDGGNPHGGVVLDTSGNLYGTAYSGGSFTGSLCATSGCGVVFKVTPSGTETVLYSFTGGADGADPRDILIRDPSGNLYGTTFYGGSFSGSQCATNGCGVAFKVTPAGKETVLHTFAGGADGANPRAGLVRDSSGNVYGTTEYGGASSKGTVFEVNHAISMPPDLNGTILPPADAFEWVHSAGKE